MSDQISISSTAMTMNLADSSSDNIATLLYLQRMKTEMLHVREQVDQKLHDIEEAIQECQQCVLVPSPSLWSRISSYIIKTASSLCNGVTSVFRAVFCGVGEASKSSSEIPHIVIDESTPLIQKLRITPTDTFMKDTATLTPPRRRHNSLGCVTPALALRLQLETNQMLAAPDTPAANNTTILTPAMRMVEPSEEWARMILSSGASAMSPASVAATPGHGPSRPQNLAPAWSQQLLDSGFSDGTK